MDSTHPDTQGTDNVLAGFIVVLVGLGVAEVTRQYEWERRLVLCVPYVRLVADAAQCVGAAVQLPDTERRKVVLRDIAATMNGCLATLQHIKADAIFQGYVGLLATRILQCADDAAATARFDETPATFSAPGDRVSQTWQIYVPTPMGLRLVELASQILDRATAVYLVRS